eukprot:scaffold144864_cov18-Tisochrysis_lutea.AAC.1
MVAGCALGTGECAALSELGIGLRCLHTVLAQPPCLASSLSFMEAPKKKKEKKNLVDLLSA